jgi:hypothetical protein
MDQIFEYRAIERLMVVAMGPLLLWIGYKLFVLGATGRMTLSARHTSLTGKITNLSPGVFCFLAATVISVVALNDKAEVDAKKTTAAGSAYADPILHKETAAGAESPRPVPPSKPEAQQSTAVVSEEIKTSYETGAPPSAKLSVEIHKRLSDAGLCILNFGNDACTKVVEGNFRKIPTEQDLKAIEDLERNAGQPDNAAKLRALRRDILNEDKH